MAGMTNSPRRIAAVSVVVVAMAMGLGIGSCDGGAGSSGAFIAQFCDVWKPCCAAAGLRSDGQQCRALYGSLLPPSRYDATAGEACLEATRAAASQPGFCEGTVPSPDVCERVFRSIGTKAPGETCVEDDECAPSSEGSVECAIAFVASAQIRKCQVTIRGVAGSTPCESFIGEDVLPRIYECSASDGLRCDATTMTCMALSPIGGACTSFSDCVAGAACNFATSMCVARREVGAACTSSTQCVETAYCDDTSGVCAARKAMGAACAGSDECTSDSCVNAMCAAGSGNFTLSFLCGEP